MAFVAVLDINELTIEEYDSIIASMGVESRPASGIYLHIAAPMEGGLRIIELWDSKEGFEQFIQERMLPAAKALGIERQTSVTVTPLHNLFVPRLAEIPHLVKK